MVKKEINIKTDVVSSDDLRHTYSVTKTIGGVDGKDGIIIQINPTITAEEINEIDSTTMHLVNHLQELGLRSVQMINLFSKICKGKMSSRNLELDIENLKYIEAIMKEKDFKDKVFIVAWGSSMASSRACNEAKRQIVTMFKKYCKNGTIYQLRSSKLDVARYPAVHVLYLGIRHKTEKWSLIPFDTSEIDGQIKENKLRIVKGDDDKWL